jgi:hypothetical protein
MNLCTLYIVSRLPFLFTRFFPSWNDIFTTEINVFATGSRYATSWCAHLGCQSRTELSAPAKIHELVHSTKRRKLVSAPVPSQSNHILLIVTLVSVDVRKSPPLIYICFVLTLK